MALWILHKNKSSIYCPPLDHCELAFHNYLCISINNFCANATYNSPGRKKNNHSSADQKIDKKQGILIFWFYSENFPQREKKTKVSLFTLNEIMSGGKMWTIGHLLVNILSNGNQKRMQCSRSYSTLQKKYPNAVGPINRRNDYEWCD